MEQVEWKFIKVIDSECEKISQELLDELATRLGGEYGRMVHGAFQIPMDDLKHQMGGLMSKEDARRMFLGNGYCTPSRDNTLTGYNVTEEFEQLEKKEDVIVSAPDVHFCWWGED